MIKYSNLLLIGGSGQNVGKTTLATDILSQFSNDSCIIYIKTSNHFHGISDSDEVVYKDEKLVITRETLKSRSKDTSRALKAGAKSAYFIQSDDEFVAYAFEKIMEKENKKCLIIGESASLRKYIYPQFFIALVNSINNEIPENKKVLKNADHFIEGYLTGKEFDLKKLIGIKANNWDININ